MIFNEVLNNNKCLQVDKMKMSCDDAGLDIPEPLQKSNFFYIMIGQPMSGKTNLWLNLINKRKKFYWKQFHKIYIFSNSLHTISNKIKLPEDQLFNGFDVEELASIISAEEGEEKEDSNKILIVFDDVITQISRNMRIMLKLLYNRRHIGSGISVIMTSQKYNKIPLEIRSVSTGIFFFETKNKSEIETLYDEYGNMKRPDFNKLLAFVFDKKYNFLYMNLLNPVNAMYYKIFNKLSIEE